MKTYFNINEQCIKLADMLIYKSEEDYYYQRFLKEIEQGEAELVPFIPSWSAVNKQRLSDLRDSDWTAMPDANPKPSKEDWLTYRQALRDIPQNFSNTTEIVWPIRPDLIS